MRRDFMEDLHAGHRKRLRQRYLDAGLSAFSDHEVLELLLTYAIPRRDVNELAHRLIARFGSLENVLNADVKELSAVSGTGESAAVFLKMEGELFARINRDRLKEPSGRILMDSQETAARFVRELHYGSADESCLLLLLDASRRLTAVRTLSEGIVDGAAVSPRSAAETALLGHAKSVILTHCHPSGNPLPSKADWDATASVSAALNGVGVAFNDHLIAGRNAVYSCASRSVTVFTENGAETIPEDRFRELLQKA